MSRDRSFRSVAPEVALAKIATTIDRLSFTADVAVTDAPISAAFVTLWQNEVKVSSGLGKGDPFDALIGAYFESLEHFATAQQRYSHGYEISRPSESFIADMRLKGDRALQILADMPGIPITCSTLTDLQSGDDVFYPAFLTDPHMDLGKAQRDLPVLQHLSSVGRYASNSGAAIGCSDEEATLHGINEVVERDLLSRAMASNVFSLDVEVCLLPPDRLPAELKQLAEAAQDIAGTEIAILFLSRPHEIPTFLVMSSSANSISCFGSGSSLCPFRAFRRAVTEYIQCIHAYERSEEMRKEHKEAEKRLENYPNLLLVGNKRWPDFAAGLKVARCDFAQICLDQIPIKPEKVPQSVEECLHKTLQVVSSNYKSILTSTIGEFGDGIIVKQTVIPEADRFYLVSSGVPVIPTEKHSPMMNG